MSAALSRYETEDGVLYDKRRARLLFYPRKKEEESFTLRPGTRSIAPLAFRGCENLVSLTMPDSVTDMGEQCICQCPNLESVWISDQIRILPSYIEDTNAVGVLSNNRKLTKVHLPKQLRLMGGNSFYNSSISRLFLPEGLTYIGHYALAKNALQEIALPKSIQLLETGSLLGIKKVTAYEGTAKGLVRAINISSENKKEWKSSWVTMLGEDGERKGLIYIPESDKPEDILELVAQAWDALSFDYELYQEAYGLMKTGDEKIFMGLILLLYGGKEELRPILKKSAKKAGQLLIELGDLPFFKAFLDQDILSKPSTTALLEECNAKGDSGFVAYLMDYREKHVKARSFSRFDL